MGVTEDWEPPDWAMSRRIRVMGAPPEPMQLDPRRRTLRPQTVEIVWRARGVDGDGWRATEVAISGAPDRGTVTTNRYYPTRGGGWEGLPGWVLPLLEASRPTTPVE